MQLTNGLNTTIAQNFHVCCFKRFVACYITPHNLTHYTVPLSQWTTSYVFCCWAFCFAVFMVSVLKFQFLLHCILVVLGQTSPCTGPQEVYDECGSPCPLTCQNMYVKELCIAMCAEGCFCEEGYIRDDYSGYCIKPEQCPLLVTI